LQTCRTQYPGCPQHLLEELLSSEGLHISIDALREELGSQSWFFPSIIQIPSELKGK